MHRSNMPFSDRVKRQAWERCQHRCEICTAWLISGKFEYDHLKPRWLGGEDILSNCRVLCINCHDDKTSNQDIPQWAKSERILNREAGIRKPRRITAWRNFRGEVVRKPRER